MEMTQEQPLQESRGPILAFGAGNGAGNVFKDLDSDPTFTDEDCNQGLFEMYLIDPDHKKAMQSLHGCTRVKEISLIDDPRFASGTGADIALGAKYAMDKRGIFQRMAEAHAAKNGHILLFGCLGGGSTGVLPVLARIFKQAGLRVQALVTMPDSQQQGGGRNNNALIVLRELQTAGASVIVLYNNRVVHESDAKLSDLHKIMNKGIIIPMLKSLRVTYQETGNVINIDYSDLEKVEGSSQYFGYYIRGFGEHTDEQIAEILTSNPLQDSEKIISAATRGVIDYQGDWSADTTRNISSLIAQKMCKVLPISLKDGMNELDRSGVPITKAASWIGFIAAANLLSSEPSNLPGLETYAMQMEKFQEELNAQPKLENGIENVPGTTADNVVPFEPRHAEEQKESFVSYEQLVMLSNGSTGFAKISIPEHLKARLTSCKTTEESQAIVQALEPYIAFAAHEHSYLKGAYAHVAVKTPKALELEEQERKEQQVRAVS